MRITFETEACGQAVINFFHVQVECTIKLLAGFLAFLLQVS
jgi:hypothetical protein